MGVAGAGFCHGRAPQGCAAGAGPGWAGTGRAMAMAGAGGEQATHASFIRYEVAGPRCSTRSNRPSPRTLRCEETVYWSSLTAAPISPTFIGRARRASSVTIWILVGSASALNQLAYSAAVTRSRG